MNSVLITQISIDELRRLVRDVVHGENDDLRKEVALLREELRLSRKVVSHRQAVHYFDSRITPETVISYIHDGLPAFKRGRIWFMYVQDIFDFQVGLICPATEEINKNVTEPRHHHNQIAENKTRRKRSFQQNGDKSVAPDARELDSHPKTSPLASPHHK